jgi:uncharacterized protein YebE (UPF0316 family)
VLVPYNRDSSDFWKLHSAEFGVMDFLNAHPWVLAPAIFLARLLDVTLGTFRTIVVFRGYPALAAAIGFVEILIWIAAVSQVLREINDWPLMIAYAGGFSCGNYLGVWLESKVAIGKELVRIISHRSDGSLTKHLDSIGQKVVSLNCVQNGVPAEVLLVTTDRRATADLLDSIRGIDPDVEYTISDIKSLRTEAAGTARRLPLIPSGWRIRGKRK